MEYAHFDGVPTTEWDAPDYEAPHSIGNRGGCVVIPLIGECGHAWNVVFAFHKGQMFVDTRDVRLTRR